MQYTATPFYNENEQKAKYLLEVVCADGESVTAEVYADDVTSEEDLKNAAITVIAVHDEESAKREAKKRAAEDALSALSVKGVPATEIKQEELAAHVEAARAKALAEKAQAEEKAEAQIEKP